jgi:vitamin-K-epoxide reductase (warfarin-sensitive)
VRGCRHKTLSHVGLRGRITRRGRSRSGVPWPGNGMFVAMTDLARRIFPLIAVLALAGIAVSSVSLYHHYQTSKTTYCDFGESFNCDIVNRSTYSTVLGIPDALIGILGYAALFSFATMFRTKSEAPLILLIASLLGLGFALYLTYIEAFVLATWCILCLSSLTLIFLITVSASVLAASSRRRA